MPALGSLPLQLVFIALPLAVLASFVVLVQRTLHRPALTRRVAGALLLWLASSAGLALSGFLARTDLGPLPMALLLFPMLALSLGSAASPLGAALAERAPLVWLVGLHAFRLPLELVMHEAARAHVMPPQMTFTGANFDIASGASAALLALALARGLAPRWLWAAWNLLGSLLLVAIIAIAIASLPHFHAFGSDREHLNTWVSHFPYVWLPAGLVAPALFGHALLWRRLWREARSERSLPAAGLPQKSLR